MTLSPAYSLNRKLARAVVCAVCACATSAQAPIGERGAGEAPSTNLAAMRLCTERTDGLRTAPSGGLLRRFQATTLIVPGIGTVNLVGGLLPTPNIAAQAGSIRPALVAIAWERRYETRWWLYPAPQSKGRRSSQAVMGGFRACNQGAATRTTIAPERLIADRDAAR
jgi:hypothetical protein